MAIAIKTEALSVNPNSCIATDYFENRSKTAKGIT
jgi:hypothetical protein